MAHVHAFHTVVRSVLAFRLGHVHALPVAHKFVNNIFKQIGFHAGEVLHFVIFAGRSELIERRHIAHGVRRLFRLRHPLIEFYSKNKELMDNMRNVALEEQAVETVLAKANVTEKATNFSELMNQQA